MNILVVDDDDADVLMIEEALSGSEGAINMHRVADGRQALDYLHDPGVSQRPDLILLDLNMPRMGGLAALAEIKDDPELVAIPVVVLTTSEASPDVQASYQRHASAFVTKPMGLEEFEEAVQKISRFYSETAVLP
ncbi:response regulator [Actinoplanes sp. TFC3]|uniref:response regulator n=1 Tax=Actinoplanes sp. TFC3 TaxID=1710355 RepID=UPI00210100F9|nr:response regulator [Actinoplanes sp. TFC3]